MIQLDTQIRVRYAETDQMGYMYYGNYASYYEVGRTELMRSVGVTYSELEKMNIMMPVIELHIKYRRAARYDDVVTVRTMLKEMPELRIKFDYELYNEAGELLNTGHVSLIFVDSQTRKPCKLPQEVYESIKGYFEK